MCAVDNIWLLLVVIDIVTVYFTLSVVETNILSFRVTYFLSQLIFQQSNFNLRHGEKATRRDIMRILLDVKEFLVRATYAKNTKVTL